MGVQEPEKAQRSMADLPPETIRPPGLETRLCEFCVCRFLRDLVLPGSLCPGAPTSPSRLPQYKVSHASSPPLGDILLAVTGLQVLLVFSGSAIFLLHFHCPPPHTPLPPHPTCRGHWPPQGPHQAPLPSLAQPAAKAWSLGRLSLRAPGPWHRQCQTAALP